MIPWTTQHSRLIMNQCESWMLLAYDGVRMGKRQDDRSISMVSHGFGKHPLLSQSAMIPWSSSKLSRESWINFAWGWKLIHRPVARRQPCCCRHRKDRPPRPQQAIKIKQSVSECRSQQCVPSGGLRHEVPKASCLDKSSHEKSLLDALGDSASDSPSNLSKTVNWIPVQ